MLIASYLRSLETNASRGAFESPPRGASAFMRPGGGFVIRPWTWHGCRLVLEERARAQGHRRSFPSASYPQRLASNPPDSLRDSETPVNSKSVKPFRGPTPKASYPSVQSPDNTMYLWSPAARQHHVELVESTQAIGSAEGNWSLHWCMLCFQ